MGRLLGGIFLLSVGLLQGACGDGRSEPPIIDAATGTEGFAQYADQISKEQTLISLNQLPQGEFDLVRYEHHHTFPEANPTGLLYRRILHWPGRISAQDRVTVKEFFPENRPKAYRLEFLLELPLRVWARPSRVQFERREHFQYEITRAHRHDLEPFTRYQSEPSWEGGREVFDLFSPAYLILGNQTRAPIYVKRAADGEIRLGYLSVDESGPAGFSVKSFWANVTLLHSNRESHQPNIEIRAKFKRVQW